MNKLILNLTIFLFISISFFKLFYVNAYSQDTIYNLSKDLRFFNYTLKYDYENGFKNVELIDDNGSIPGYLIIQIDSNTKNEKYTLLPDTTIEYSNISPTVYFVIRDIYEKENGELIIDSALERLECDSCRIYDMLSKDELVYQGYYRFIDGFRDDLTNFLYYFNVFGSIPCSSEDKKWIAGILTTDILNNKSIWYKSNNKIGYVIYKIFFRTAILKYYQKKFYLAMSSVNYFKEVSEDILIKHGFKKSDKIIIVN